MADDRPLSMKASAKVELTPEMQKLQKMAKALNAGNGLGSGAYQSQHIVKVLLEPKKAFETTGWRYSKLKHPTLEQKIALIEIAREYEEASNGSLKVEFVTSGSAEIYLLQGTNAKSSDYAAETVEGNIYEKILDGHREIIIPESSNFKPEDFKKGGKGYAMLMHEFGHALGLEHSPEVGERGEVQHLDHSIMNPLLSPGGAVPDLRRGERAAVKIMYPGKDNALTENDTIEHIELGRANFPFIIKDGRTVVRDIGSLIKNKDGELDYKEKSSNRLLVEANSGIDNVILNYSANFRQLEVYDSKFKKMDMVHHTGLKAGDKPVDGTLLRFTGQKDELLASVFVVGVTPSELKSHLSLAPRIVKNTSIDHNYLTPSQDNLSMPLSPLMMKALAEALDPNYVPTDNMLHTPSAKKSGQIKPKSPSK